MFKTQAKRLEKIRQAILSLNSLLISLTGEIGHEELHQTALDVRKHLEDPFLFVIVGEVKAGKSSFINALLGTEKDICRVAPSPMTDTIQQIVYGEQESEVFINTYLKRITHPVEILREISIVDTPGTNTIIEHHQEITERFIPAADLIVFVFEAKNPYRESAWKFFDFINAEWWKKVIFVLQQKDLLDQGDLEINIKGVTDHAKKKGISEPNVFAVSAKLEQSALKENSGYTELRNYINQHILGGKAPVLKQQNNLSTIHNIHHKIQNGLTIRQHQYQLDQSFRNDIVETLNKQEEVSSRQVDMLVENLIAEYDNVTRPRVKEIADGLGFMSMMSRSIGSAFGTTEKPKDWLSRILSELETTLNHKLKTKLNDGVIDIADSIQQMGKMVDLKIRNSKTVLKDDHEIFSDIAERRANVLRDLQQSFTHFLSDSKNFYDSSITKTSESISPNLAAGSGIAIVGLVMATVTNGMVFDITGGVLTTAGLLLAGVTLGFKRRKILSEFEHEVDAGRLKFNTDVSEHLKRYIFTIKERIEANFTRFDEHLLKEKNDLAAFSSKMTSAYDSIQELNRHIQEELIN